ncbi:---NA--- : [Gemmataceae bacterium]|nr:---NA--- : [Gemmataceae bacterium]VTT97562.1 ---NA--- : [Gemmataceae bacterium]
MSNALGPLAAVVVGIGVFLGAFFVIKKRQPEPAPPPPPVAKPDPEPKPPQPAPDPVPPADPEPKKADPEPPKKPAAAFVLARWKSADAEPKDKNKRETDVIDAAFARAAGTVTLRTREAVQVHNAATGKLLHAMRADPNMAALSSDGASVAVVRPSGTGVDIYSSDGLTRTGSWAAPMSIYHSYTRFKFSPGGTSFVLADSLVEADRNSAGYAFTTLSTSGTGTRWPNRLARPDKALLRFGSVVAVPKYDRAIYSDALAKDGQPKVFAIDARTSTTTPLRSVTITPAEFPDVPSLELSADSTLLLARNGGEAQVVDWRADKPRLTLRAEPWGTSSVWLRHAALTPDGKHLVVVREYPEFYYVSGPKAGQKVQAPTSIDLHPIGTDPAAAKPVATVRVTDLGLANRVTALAVSRDGKAVVAAAGPDVRVLDFAAAFGVAPGKSLAPSAAEESLLSP